MCGTNALQSGKWAVAGGTCAAAGFTIDAPRAKVRGPASPEVGIGGGQTRIYLYDHPAGDKEVGGGGERTRNGLANESLLTKDP